MTLIATDLFMDMNNRRYLWMFDETVPVSWRPPEGFAAALDYDVANDLYGIKEADDVVSPTVILPKGGAPSRPSGLNGYMTYHKHEIKVIYECPCPADKKLRHHFDYSDPLRVMLLCRKCHAVEHARIDQEAKMLLINMITVKMLFSRLSGNRLSKLQGGRSGPVLPKRGTNNQEGICVNI